MWITNYCYPRFGSDGNFIGYNGFAVDITKIKQTQEKADLLLKAIEAVKYGIVICNEKRQIEWVNPAFTEILGYSLNEVQGKKPEEFLNSNLLNIKFFKSFDEKPIGENVWKGVIDRRKKMGYCCIKLTIVLLKTIKTRLKIT
jgi:c-di-AMP phosphodiesterase-like protein